MTPLQSEILAQAYVNFSKSVILLENSGSDTFGQATAMIYRARADRLKRAIVFAENALKTDEAVTVAFQKLREMHKA